MPHGEFQRNTRQRRVILEELAKLTSHPTAGELYEIVRKRLPKISLGTVYRNLESLSRQGRIRKLETSGAENRFDIDLRSHHHLQCRICGKVEDAPDTPGNLEIGDIKHLGGYDILEHRLEFIGICPDCRIEESERKEGGGRVIW